MPIPKNESALNAWIMIGFGSVFVLIGGFVVYLAIQMVGTFGESMGVDETSRVIYSWAHVAVHLFGTASSVAFGLFIRKRRKMLATLALLATTLCGSYGIVNMIGSPRPIGCR
jgi:membrane associated rhomboid family serine protease